MERITTLLNELLSSFTSIFPKILMAVLVFFIGWIVAKTVSRIIQRILRTLKVDQLAEKLNEIDFIDKSNFTIVPSKILSNIIYYMILLVVTIVATEILDIQAVSDLVRDIINYIPNVIAAIIVLAIGLLLAQFLQKLVVTTMQSLGIPSAKVIGAFIFYFIFLMTVITALTQIGIDTNFISNNLTVIIGGGVLAFGLGYGLASRDTMANFLASFYSKDKVGLGDVIIVEGLQGEIIKMDSTSLVLWTEEKREIILPLSRLTTSPIEIISRGELE